MLHKFRLLLTTATLAIFLIACGSETNDNAESTDQALDSVEVQSEEASTTADTSNETQESETDTATEENETVADEAEEDTSETADSKTTESETTEPAEKPVEETTEENKDARFQVAVQKILEATDLNAEDYVFTFENTEDYIEVEVREKTEDEVTPLAGIYRYFPETDEVLISDYLTGEFIPYDDVQ